MAHQVSIESAVPAALYFMYTRYLQEGMKAACSWCLAKRVEVVGLELLLFPRATATFHEYMTWTTVEKLTPASLQLQCLSSAEETSSMITKVKNSITCQYVLLTE